MKDGLLRNCQPILAALMLDKSEQLIRLSHGPIWMGQEGIVKFRIDVLHTQTAMRKGAHHRKSARIELLATFHGWLSRSRASEPGVI